MDIDKNTIIERMSKDEVKLIKKCQEKDIKSFEEIFKRYQKRIFNLAYRMSGNWTDAEDLLQEIFIKLHNVIGSYQFKSTFAVWLYRVAINTCKNKLRDWSRTKKQDRPIDGIDNLNNVVHMSTYNIIERKAESEKVEDNIEKTLLKLPQKYRILIVLRDLQNLSYSEISRIIGISIGTVKSRLCRARNMFKNQYKKMFSKTGSIHEL